MAYLVLVSLLWSFSFGVIKVWLADLDAFFVAAVRLFWALLVFLPFFRLGRFKRRDYSQLLLIGAVQYGVMYMAFIYCFSVLKAYEAALFSIFTPLYVILFNYIIRGGWQNRFFVSAALSVIGAGIIKYASFGSEGWLAGFLLMQLSNASFAFGQIYYKHWRQKHPEFQNHEVFAVVYLGSFLLTGLMALAFTDWSTLTVTVEQHAALFYLGVVASGLGLFFWNVGATKTGPGALAVSNNLLVPLAVIVSLVVFNEGQSLNRGEWLRLIIGGGVLLLALSIKGKVEAPNLSKKIAC